MQKFTQIFYMNSRTDNFLLSCNQFLEKTHFIHFSPQKKFSQHFHSKSRAFSSPKKNFGSFFLSHKHTLTRSCSVVQKANIDKRLQKNDSLSFAQLRMWSCWEEEQKLRIIAERRWKWDGQMWCFQERMSGLCIAFCCIMGSGLWMILIDKEIFLNCGQFCRKFEFFAWNLWWKFLEFF